MHVSWYKKLERMQAAVALCSFLVCLFVCFLATGHLSQFVIPFPPSLHLSHSFGKPMVYSHMNLSHTLQGEVLSQLQCMLELCFDPAHCLVSAAVTICTGSYQSCVLYALPFAARIYSMHCLLQLFCALTLPSPHKCFASALFTLCPSFIPVAVIKY